ncbi:NUDIX hydrolase [Streptomyces sp. NPDC054863]
MSERVDRVDEWDRVLGVVDRAEAIREGWLHRVATVVCRDEAGRILVHRRPETVSRFPGRYNWLLGGAVDTGESYQDAAARELAEELGVRAPVRPVFKFLCRGAISPYWLAVHEAVVAEAVTPDPAEIAWHDWLPEVTFREVLWQWPFVADGREAFMRYEARGTEVCSTEGRGTEGRGTEVRGMRCCSGCRPGAGGRGET